MKRLFVLLGFLLSLACSQSCMTLALVAGLAEGERQARQERRYYGYEFGNTIADMRLTTIQKISRHAALATTGNGKVVCVVTAFGEYYDGMVISGEFVRNGTYTYETLNGANKEVLVYVYKPAYFALKDYRP